MARFKQQSTVTAGVRDYLLERYQSLSDRYAALQGCPWHRLVEQLEHGEPVTVPGYVLREILPDVVRDLRYEVRFDDSVHLVSPRA